MRTMVATNQRDYATISHMDVTGSHDKSSCRSATINNNIRTAGWRDGWCDSSSLNSVIRSRRACYFAGLGSPECAPLRAIINRSMRDGRAQEFHGDGTSRWCKIYARDDRFPASTLPFIMIDIHKFLFLALFVDNFSATAVEKFM